MTPYLIAGAITAFALVVVFVAYLWLTSRKPDDAHLDEVNKCAMPYDSMYVQPTSREQAAAELAQWADLPLPRAIEELLP